MSRGLGPSFGWHVSHRRKPTDWWAYLTSGWSDPRDRWLGILSIDKQDNLGGITVNKLHRSLKELCPLHLIGETCRTHFSLTPSPWQLSQLSVPLAHKSQARHIQMPKNETLLMQ